jgi:hypothetical protein
LPHIARVYATENVRAKRERSFIVRLNTVGALSEKFPWDHELYLYLVGGYKSGSGSRYVPNRLSLRTPQCSDVGLIEHVKALSEGLSMTVHFLMIRKIEFSDTPDRFYSKGHLL